MTVFILRPDLTKLGLNRQIAHIGFAQRGEEVRLFDMDEMDALPLGPDDIVFGGIGTAHAAFRRLGIPIPETPSIPEPLRRFAGRRAWTTTFAEVRRAVDRGETLFAKPRADNHKLFDGRVFSRFADLIPSAHVPDETLVDCAEITPFAAEFRGYVVHGDLLGLFPYKGEPLTFPDPEVVRAALAAWPEAPAGYALDIGVAEDGRTLLVEVNDGYASGNYGLGPMRYVQMIEARWTELRRTAR